MVKLGPEKIYRDSPRVKRLPEAKYIALCEAARDAVEAVLTELHLEELGAGPNDGGAIVQGAVAGILQYGIGGCKDAEPVRALIVDCANALAPQLTLSIQSELPEGNA